MTTASKFTGLARRMKNAGLIVSRSDRSETIYLEIGDATLRLAQHALGVADYGTRQQRHKGPEVIAAATDSPAVIAGECLIAAREWVRDFASQWGARSRVKAAAALRILRKLAR